MTTGKGMPDWANIIALVVGGGAVTAFWNVAKEIWLMKSKRKQEDMEEARKEREARQELEAKRHSERMSVEAQREASATKTYNILLETMRNRVEQIAAENEKMETRHRVEMSELRKSYEETLATLREAHDSLVNKLRTENARLLMENVSIRGEVRLLMLSLYQSRGMDPLGGAHGWTDACIITDEDGRILQVNPAASILFHYEEKEMVGRNLTMLMPERFRDKHRKGLEMIQKSGRPPDSSSMACSVALTRDREEIPITLQLTAWTRDGRWVFAAMLRRRIDPTPTFEPEVVEGQTVEVKGTMAGVMTAVPVPVPVAVPVPTPKDE